MHFGSPFVSEIFVDCSAQVTNRCGKDTDFLKTKSKDLNDGFWMLSYRGQRGLVETAWKHAIFLVEKTCIGVFESIESIRGLGCTLIRGSLTLSGLNDSNQSELDTIGRIVGNLYIVNGQLTKLNALPNLQEILGKLDISVETLQALEGFKSLTFVLNGIDINCENLQTIEAFEKLQIISGNLKITGVSSKLAIHPFENLQAVEGAIEIIDVDISNLEFLRSIRSTNTIYLSNLKLSDISGLYSIESLNTLSINRCLTLQSLRGAPKLRSLVALNLYDLNLSNLKGIGTIQSVDQLVIDGLSELTSLRTESETPLLITKNLSISGDTKLIDLSELRFGHHLQELTLQSGNLSSIKGLEDIEEIENIMLEDLTSLTSLDGLENLKFISYFSLENTLVSNLDPLNQLTTIKGIMDFSDNPHLENLIGLGNLKFVGGDLSFRETGIQSLKGLAPGLLIGGQLFLTENNNLKDLTGLNRINEINKDLIVTNNPNLKSLKGLEGLMIKGNVLIGYSSFNNEDEISSLTDLTPLKEIRGIGGGLRINSAVCTKTEFLYILDQKVMGAPLEDLAQIPEGEPKIFIKQPSICL